MPTIYIQHVIDNRKHKILNEVLNSTSESQDLTHEDAIYFILLPRKRHPCLSFGIQESLLSLLLVKFEVMIKDFFLKKKTQLHTDQITTIRMKCTKIARKSNRSRQLMTIHRRPQHRTVKTQSLQQSSTAHGKT